MPALAWAEGSPPWRSVVAGVSGVLLPAYGVLDASWNAASNRAADIDPGLAAYAFDVGNLGFANIWVAMAASRSPPAGCLSRRVDAAALGWWRSPRRCRPGAGLIRLDQRGLASVLRLWIWVITVCILLIRARVRPTHSALATARFQRSTSSSARWSWRPSCCSSTWPASACSACRRTSCSICTPPMAGSVLPLLILLNIPAVPRARPDPAVCAGAGRAARAADFVIFVIAIVTTGSNPFEDVVITPVGTAILSLHAVNGLVILGWPCCRPAARWHSRAGSRPPIPRRPSRSPPHAMTTVALLGPDLVLSLVAVGLWATAALRVGWSPGRWALAGSAGAGASGRWLVLAGRAGACRRPAGWGRAGSAHRRWCCWPGATAAYGRRLGAAGAGAVSLVLTSVVVTRSGQVARIRPTTRTTTGGPGSR